MIQYQLWTQSRINLCHFCSNFSRISNVLFDAKMETLPILWCDASKWTNYTARCIVSAAIRNMRHHITAINRCMRIIISNVNFRLVYQIRCPFATLKFLFVNILIVLDAFTRHFCKRNICDKKIKNPFHSHNNFSFYFNIFIKSNFKSELILTAGMTSAGFRRFFVRRQSNTNTTTMKKIIIKNIVATMILNTGLVSEIMQSEFKFMTLIEYRTDVSCLIEFRVFSFPFLVSLFTLSK